jgi:hypothetical protein
MEEVCSGCSSIGREKTVDESGASSRVGKSPLSLLCELAALKGPLLAIQIPKEIQEVAEELASRCDSFEIENDRPLVLLQVALYLDRHHRSV